MLESIYIYIYECADLEIFDVISGKILNEGEIKMARVELVGDKDTKKRFFRLDLEFWVDFQRVKTLDMYMRIREYIFGYEMVRNYIYETLILFGTRYVVSKFPGLTDFRFAP